MALFCMASTFGGSVLAQDAGLSLSMTDRSIQDCIDHIERTTDYVFIFNKDIDTGQHVSISVSGATINELLQKLFYGTGIGYSIQGKQISLSKTAPQKKTSSTHIVKGVVTDDSGEEPLIGVGVLVKGTGTGTITNDLGEYSIEVPENATLIFSYIGFRQSEILVGDLAILNVKMMLDNEIMDAVVVGAGTQKRVSVTGSITAVAGDRLRAPSSSLTNNLAGKLSGVISVTTSGEPGSTSSFYIRGINTFGGRSTPLILLDGVEISAADLNNIPPETIESFSILKDASATAIYGARGANGVMLITTKTGTENTKAKINVTYEHSFLQPVNVVDYTDGVTFMETYNYAHRMRSSSPLQKYSDVKIEGTRNHVNEYVYPDVDWYSLMLKKFTMNERANINIQGGGSHVTYYMSLQLNHDSGMLNVPKNYSLDNNHNQMRYIFQNNLQYKVSNSTTLGLRMNAQISNLKSPNTSSDAIFKEIYNNNPVLYPAVFPDDGCGHMKFGSEFINSGSYYTNPYANMLNSFKEVNENKLNVSLNFDQKLDFITQGLSLSALVNFNAWSNASYTRSLSPYLYRVAPESYNVVADKYVLDLLKEGETYINQSGVSKTSDNLFYFDARANYNRRFGKHTVTGMLMYMMRQYRTSVLPSRNQGFSGRATYDYDHRYLAEVNFGYNGTERLGKGERFELFPAMSLGWVVSNEKFWTPLKNVVTHLKIRSSYGLVGSDETGGSNAPYYMYMYKVNLNGGPFFQSGMQSDYSYQYNGPIITDYPVENPSWERSKQFDIGLDIHLFDDLQIVFDWFDYQRERILIERASFPDIMGYMGVKPWANLGKVNNRGVEFSVNYRKEIIPELTIDLRSNFTYTANKLIYKDEPEYDYSWQTQTGKPLNALYGFICDGFFSDEEDIARHADQSFFGSHVMPGDLKYRDINGDGAITSEDQVMLSPYGSTPRIQYGFGISVTWKKLDASVFFNGSAKRKIMLDPSSMQPFNQSWTADRNLMQWIADGYWKEGTDNSKAVWPRLATAQAQQENNLNPSTFWMKDGSFLRFKTLEVGYTFPHCRVYVSGDNLAVWSKFKYWDPELQYSTYPLSRTFNVGVQVNF